MSRPTETSPAPRRVALLTLGCARNEVDSEELAGRLDGGGWELTDDAAEADVVVVNTCGFIEQAKKDSIDTVLSASDVAAESGAKVVAVGCLAERYGAELAANLPEADAVLGFDHYAELGARLDDVLAGRTIAAHSPTDRRTLLPITPVQRPAAADDVALPGHGWGPSTFRRRLAEAPVAPLKIASGCDRRCTFCAIPSFRGAFVSRPPADILGEAAWLAEQGVRELYLVSENSTSYGKDLGADDGGVRALELLLPRLGAIPGIERVRVSYLQPAETRPGLVRAIAGSDGVARYFDLSFQHASPAVLRRMRRFGSTADFLGLIATIRELAPEAGIRSNFIVGFPGETEEDVAELAHFLTEARLDAIGVFGYSDEDGTEAENLDGKLPAEVVAERLGRIAELAERLTAQRAEDRIGEEVLVLVESVSTMDDDALDDDTVDDDVLDDDTADDDAVDAVDDEGGDGADGVPEVIGRAEHQAPEVDGECVLLLDDGAEVPAVGDLVRGVVVAADGVDLTVRLLPDAAGEVAGSGAR